MESITNRNEKIISTNYKLHCFDSLIEFILKQEIKKTGKQELYFIFIIKGDNADLTKQTMLSILVSLSL